MNRAIERSVLVAARGAAPASFPAPETRQREDMSVLSYIVWAMAIVVCFYLGAKLTFQVRERKKKLLRIDFDQAKEREKDGRL